MATASAPSHNALLSPESTACVVRLAKTLVRGLDAEFHILIQSPGQPVQTAGLLFGKTQGLSLKIDSLQSFAMEGVGPISGPEVLVVRNLYTWEGPGGHRGPEAGSAGGIASPGRPGPWLSHAGLSHGTGSSRWNFGPNI